MTNTSHPNISSLSGLELRKRIGEGLSWSVGETNLAKGEGFVLFKPDGEFYYPDSEGWRTYATVDEAWAALPAFEKDLGALQAAGIVDVVLHSESFIETQKSNKGKDHYWVTVRPYEFDEDAPELPPHDCITGEALAKLPSEGMATAVCRAWLTLQEKTV